MVVGKVLLTKTRMLSCSLRCKSGVTHTTVLSLGKHKSSRQSTNKRADGLIPTPPVHTMSP